MLAQSKSSASRSRAGFTFLEVLFACALLAIGFIMVAAVFPVAIRETQTASDEAIGMAITRDAERFLQAQIYGNYYSNLTNGNMFPSADIGTGRVYAFSPSNCEDITILDQNGRWQSDQGIGNTVCSFDNRYGWVGFWRRDKDASGNPLPYIQTWVISVRSTMNTGYSNYNWNDGQPCFTPPDLIWNNGVTPATRSGSPWSGTSDCMQPVQTAIFKYLGPTTPGQVEFPLLPSPTNTSIPDASLGPDAEGAFVLVAQVPSGSGLQSMVGRVYRLGANISSTSLNGGADTWTLQPGYDITLADLNQGNPNGSTTSTGNNTIYVFMVGRQSGLWNGNGGTFIGPAQDLTCHTSIVQVNF